MLNPAVVQACATHSTGELLAGTLINCKVSCFNEEDITQLFLELDEAPSGNRRFGIRRTGTGLRSDPLQEMLSFFRIGKMLGLLDTPGPNRYYIIPTARQALRTFMRSRCFTAEGEEVAFRACATRFDEIVLEHASARAQPRRSNG